MRLALFSLVLALSGTACDHGLEPPEAPPVGSVRGIVTYVDPSAWPPLDSLRDLRFFALPFVPRDTLDFFRDINQLVFSETLKMYVAGDTFFVENVRAQFYLYSGIAQQYDNDLLAWRPVGLSPDTGLLLVRPGAVTEVSITVDFRNLPPFPPPLP